MYHRKLYESCYTGYSITWCHCTNVSSHHHIHHTAIAPIPPQYGSTMTFDCTAIRYHCTVPTSQAFWVRRSDFHFSIWYPKILTHLYDSKWGKVFFVQSDGYTGAVWQYHVTMVKSYNATMLQLYSSTALLKLIHLDFRWWNSPHRPHGSWLTWQCEWDPPHEAASRQCLKNRWLKPHREAEWRARSCHFTLSCLYLLLMEEILHHLGCIKPCK